MRNTNDTDSVAAVPTSNAVKTREASPANWTAIIFGAWLFLSPWVLFSGLTAEMAATANMNFWIVGAAVVISSAIALSNLHPWEEWTNLVLGAWLFISPWALGFAESGSYLWNALIVGGAFIVSSGVALPIAYRPERRVEARAR